MTKFEVRNNMAIKTTPGQQNRAIWAKIDHFYSKARFCSFGAPKLPFLGRKPNLFIFKALDHDFCQDGRFCPPCEVLRWGMYVVLRCSSNSGFRLQKQKKDPYPQDKVQRNDYIKTPGVLPQNCIFMLEK